MKHLIQPTPPNHGPFQMLLPIFLVLVSLGFGNLLHAQTVSKVPVPPRSLPTTGLPSSSILIEAVGTVEYRLSPASPWMPAKKDTLFPHHSQIRTLDNSRALIRFTDRSTLRLGENTILELLPSEIDNPKRFSLPKGLLYFFNREKPSSIEIETPLMTGSIRGTEFVMETLDPSQETRIALIDGLLSLQSNQAPLSAQPIQLSSGNQIHWFPGNRPPEIRPLLEIPSRVQWTLYYPSLVIPQDFPLSPASQSALAPVLNLYLSGNLLEAHTQIHSSRFAPGNASPEIQAWKAILDLAVGKPESLFPFLTSPQHSGPLPPALQSALNEFLQMTQGNALPPNDLPAPTNASQHLVRSYTLQAAFQLPEALLHAREALRLAPDVGFLHARLAELEMSFDRLPQARMALEMAQNLAPASAYPPALQGFLMLRQNKARQAIPAFESALEKEPSMGLPWLGLGLALSSLNRSSEAIQALQIAATLEPRRSLFRSYLAKAYLTHRELGSTLKDLHMAQSLDPDDPTAWFYSALYHWHQFHPNTAIHDLEHAISLNDNLAPFRSRLLLDQDRALRNANLAALYHEANLPERARQIAAQALLDDFLNPSAHLFLAQSYQTLDQPNRVDLRYESVRQGEWLLASLLAPAGAANLSQIFSQQQLLQWFNPRPIGLTSLSSYRSTGDWSQFLSLYGSTNRFSYALDLSHDSQHGQAINDTLDRTDFALNFKQGLTEQDELYLQFSVASAEMGDLSRYYDPRQAKKTLSAEETQAPNLYLGWHRTWTPKHHSLLLFSHHQNQLTLQDPRPNVLFLQNRGGLPFALSTPPLFSLDSESDFSLQNLDLQHIWSSSPHALILGTRLQYGNIETTANLNRQITGPVTQQSLDEPFQRWTSYAYYQAHLGTTLKAIVGVQYDALRLPENLDLPPLSTRSDSHHLLAPKIGFTWNPSKHLSLRGAYSQALTGYSFDQSLRLEPTQLAGFNQTYRSLIPESFSGLVPASKLHLANLALDLSTSTSTYGGIELEWKQSQGDRSVGTLTHTQPVPLPDTPTQLQQNLDFQESGLSAYLVQLIGNGLSLGVRHEIRRSEIQESFPHLPSNVIGLDPLERDESSTWHQTSLSATYQHEKGPYARFESVRYQQQNKNSLLATEDPRFWQHHLLLGYRFPRRQAEIQFGLLNLTDEYKPLSPLNTYSWIPRKRTLSVSLRLNF